MHGTYAVPQLFESGRYRWHRLSPELMLIVPGMRPKVPAGAWADRRLKACYEYVIACDAGAAGGAVQCMAGP